MLGEGYNKMEKTDDTKLLRQIADSLDELVKLTKIMSFPMVKQTLEAALDTEQKRVVYQLLDGNKTVAEIEKISGANPRFISEWGQEWEKIGIVKRETPGRKAKRKWLFNLTTFGIDVPEISTDNNNVA